MSTDLMPFEVVKAKYPTAHAMLVKGGYIDKLDRWEIVNGGGHRLGWGFTQLEAWEDAAS